jgi:hypothetical protein
MLTPYPARDKVAIALSLIGSASGRPTDVVLSEVEMVLRGATTQEIAMTRHLAEAGLTHG